MSVADVMDKVVLAKTARHACSFFNSVFFCFLVFLSFSFFIDGLHVRVVQPF